MAILYGNLNILVYSDEEETNNPKSKIVDIKEVISDSSVSQFQPILLQIANGTVDQSINFNNISNIEYLFILSDQPISIKLNGSVTAVQTTKFYIQGSNITSLSISNSSGSLASVRLGIGK